MLNGIINVYKEAGFTSHDVVAKMRGICGQKKVGHTGTLDPAACGVLPVCLGCGTKLCDMLSDWDKEYIAGLLLGVTTNTQDMTGQILTESNVHLSEEDVVRVISSFEGEYLQVPPMYSARKINGKKLYELARAGKEVERTPRAVTIYETEIMEIDLPRVLMRVVCSKGTYIRTLCADIGEKLGCGGVMESLQRSRVGKFELKDAFSLDDIQKLRDDGRLSEVIMPVDSVFDDLVSIHIKDAYLYLIRNGNPFAPGQSVEGQRYGNGVKVKIYDEGNNFYGIYSFDDECERYRPVKMFLSE